MTTVAELIDQLEGCNPADEVKLFDHNSSWEAVPFDNLGQMAGFVVLESAPEDHGHEEVEEPLEPDEFEGV